MWQKPERDEWGSGVEALECALQLEKNVNQSLLDLHKVASEHNDPHVSVHMQLPKLLWKMAPTVTFEHGVMLVTPCQVSGQATVFSNLVLLLSSWLSWAVS